MEQKILMLKGLPASGKSTYAKQLVGSEPNKWKRVNRDSLRTMFAEEFNDRNEKFILQLRDIVIDKALSNGYSVIIDDLNISKKHFARIQSMFGKKAEIEINDSFLSVPLDELIQRNANRPENEQVPEKIIRDLYEQHVSGVTKEVRGRMFKNVAENRNYTPYDPNLEDAVIFDIDGTLALMNGRSPFDWSRVGEDLPNEPVVRMFQKFVDDPGVSVYVVSGRDGSCRTETLNWMETYGILGFNWLYMRPENDGRKDSIIKEEIYREKFEGKYNVIAVFDDRNQTVEKWRELGLLCLQVAPGNF